MDRKTIFITGAAGGMGLATGHHFAERGWFVGLFDLDEARLAEAAAGFDGDQVMFRRLDVTETGRTLREHGLRIVETIRRIIDINVMGVIIGIRAALPLLKETPGSLCMSTSSSVATYGHAMRAAMLALGSTEPFAHPP